jgi:hypothetical protein
MMLTARMADSQPPAGLFLAGRDFPSSWRWMVTQPGNLPHDPRGNQVGRYFFAVGEKDTQAPNPHVLGHLRSTGTEDTTFPGSEG